MPREIHMGEHGCGRTCMCAFFSFCHYRGVFGILSRIFLCLIRHVFYVIDRLTSRLCIINTQKQRKKRKRKEGECVCV